MKSEEGGGGAVRGRAGVFIGENIMDGPLKCVACERKVTHECV